MFHVKNLGSFKGYVEKFADRQGYVPEIGDKLKDFSYPDGFDFCGDGNENNSGWLAWVQEASEATKESQKEIDKWNQNNLNR